MQQTKSRSKKPALKLPGSAPQVRLTAGVGSPSQKTWNLRRPVTLIGSGRPAVIVLHDREVSKAHCVIINTGTDVLLKDLHTRGGTLRNQERVDLIALEDGDVVRVGDTIMQIAIHVPNDVKDDSGCDVEFLDPRKFPKPITLQLEHTERIWRIEDAVTLLGRHEQAAIRLDHESISERHAILFRYGRLPAVYDLDSRTGTLINDEASTFPVTISNGDSLGLGPLKLMVSNTDTAGPKGTALGSELEDAPLPPSEEPNPELIEIAGKLASLQENISSSWNRLNIQERADDAVPEKARAKTLELDARESSLDARDATLRGYMHDVTRYHDELCARERELAAQLARIQAQRDELTSAERAQEIRQVEVDKRGEELKRREHVLAQRWARLSSVSCPHCGEPINASALQ